MFILLFLCACVCVCFYPIQKLSLTEDVAGATFMATGSSAPELFASIIGITHTHTHTHTHLAHYRTAEPNETLFAVPYVCVTMTNEGGLLSLMLWRCLHVGNYPFVPWF